MAREREVKTETDFWGNDREIIYEDGRKVGEYRMEERGGFLGIGAETVKVEHDSGGSERGYTKQEERGGFLGIGAEEVEVSYSPDHDERGYSRVEERGGILGIGAHHVRVGYDDDGNEVSQTNWEERGGIFGIGARRVRVTRYSDTPGSSAGASRGASSGGYGASSGYGETSSGYSGSLSQSDLGGGFGWAVGIVLLLLGVAFCASIQNRSPGHVESQQPAIPAPVVDTSASAPATFSPSFDCTRATTWVEQQVCRSEALSGADQELAGMFRAALAAASPEYRADLIANQRFWIKQRDACESAGPPEQCIAEAYRQRIGELRTPAPPSEAAAVDDEPADIAPPFPAADIAPPDMAAFTVQFETPDGEALTRAEQIIRNVPGVRGTVVNSLALGGISLVQVSYDGSPRELARELARRGWRVTWQGSVLRLE